MSDRDYVPLVNSWLSDLGRYLGLFDPLALDDEGICFVPHPAKIDVDIELPSDSSTMFIYSPLSKVDPHSREEIYEVALSLNLFQIQTNGGAVAFDKAASELMYCIRIEVGEFDSHKFLQKFTEFVQTTQHLAARIKGESTSGVPQSQMGQTSQKMGMVESMIPRGFSIKV